MILPNDLEPRAFLGTDAVSFSELSTLARCEAAWSFGYTGEREKSAPSTAMKLGTELHRLWGQYQMDQPYLDTEDEKAAWLMERYAEHYDCRLNMLENEKPIAARFAWGPWFFGFADGLVVDSNGEMWVAELKSTDQLSKVTSLMQSPQTRLYVWALRQMGYPVAGAMLDVIRTFKPVRKELPLEESFDRRWLRHSDAEIADALGQAMRATKARRELLAGETPLKNIGPSCSWCFAQPVCYGLDVELADETDEF